ncbi:MAG: hypothetical protein R3B52_01320 [Candidatus Paceibacterota bacterium]
MLIYLFGKDAYRRQQKTAELVASFKEKNPQGKYATFALSAKDDFDKLLTFCSDTSLFAKKTLAVVFDIEKGPTETTKFLKNFLEDKNTTLVVVSEKKLPAKFKFLLTKPAISQEFEELKGAQLKTFIKKEAEKRDFKISDEHIAELIEANGGDLFATTNDIEKWALGAKDGLNIKESLDFFPSINALRGSLPQEKKLKILNTLLKNEDPAAIFNMIAALSAPQAKEKMANYDLLIKAGKLEYPEVLLDIVLS